MELAGSFEVELDSGSDDEGRQEDLCELGAASIDPVVVEVEAPLRLRARLPPRRL